MIAVVDQKGRAVAFVQPSPATGAVQVGVVDGDAFAVVDDVELTGLLSVAPEVARRLAVALLDAANVVEMPTRRPR